MAILHSTADSKVPRGTSIRDSALNADANVKSTAMEKPETSLVGSARDTSDNHVPGSSTNDSSHDNLGTKGQNLPAQGDMENTLGEAADGQESLPQDGPSSDSTAPQGISSFSSEVSGNTPGTTGGVGSLPGTVSETSIAKLPEERAQENGHPASPSHETKKHINISKFLPTKSPSPNSASCYINTQSQSNLDGSKSSLPASASSANFPGTVSHGTKYHPEPNAPASPEEADAKDTTNKDTENVDDHYQSTQVPILNTTPRTHPLAGPGAKWKGIPLDESYQRALDEDPDRGLNIGVDTDITGLRARRVSERNREGEGFGEIPVDDSSTRILSHVNLDSMAAESGVSTHEQEPSKASSDILPITSSAPNNGARFEETSGGRDDGDGSPRKTRFVDKVKGEAKVITGKLGRNKEKVEEGKRMIGKV